MAQGIKASNGHNSVPVVALHHNPKVKTSDQPAAGQARGKTMLAMDRTHPAGYQPGSSKPMGRC